MRDVAWLPRVLGAAYLVLGLVGVVVLARLVPPFQNPDELAHVLRAEQVEQGGVLGRRFLDEGRAAAGGFLDGGALSVYGVFEPLVFQPGYRATAEMFARADTVPWGGKRWWQAFDNTAVYPPFLYAPAAGVIAAGRVGGWTVVRTLHVARLCDGVAAVAVGALAVWAAGGVAPLVFALLSLPMALSLMAAVSQDAMLLPVAALAGGLLVRLRAGEGRAALWGMCLCLALAGMARPVYLPVAVLPLLAEGVAWRVRVAGAAVVAGCVLAWVGFAAQGALVDGSEGGLADAGAQLAWLWAEPGRAWQVAVRTMEVHASALAEGFVGRLGWLDLELPHWVRRVAWASLGLGLLTSAAPGAWGGRAVAFGAVVASAGAVFAVQYLTWTPVGLGVVMGVQGRYFLPLALLAGAALPGRAVLPRQAALLLPGMGAVALGGVVWAVVGRYYLR
ncbi:MAG: DUF2142 domain-containing protein [Janthinobacterium lividum]